MLTHSFVRAFLPLVCLAAGCGGTQIGYGPSGGTLNDDPDKAVTLVHEPCDTGSSGAIGLDANHDGKPDAIRVMESGREVCRGIHVDGDGKPDSYVYFDPNGGVRRQEVDSNGDGRIDSIATYKNGALHSTATDSDQNGKPDTWEYYQDGKLVKRLRDANGNGKVDEWWTYLGKAHGCADVHHDHDEDGKIDLKTEVCEASATPASSATKK